MGNLFTTELYHSLHHSDNLYNSLDEVEKALQEQGLECSNLIIGIDYTKSNTWNGMNSFNNKSLHMIQPDQQNPYQNVISIMGKTLKSIHSNNIIQTFGFGDSKTIHTTVFPYPQCIGFESVLQHYNLITPTLQLSGPTSFIPIIKNSINIVRKNYSYHILVIIADGGMDEIDKNKKIIKEASYYPLSIIMIGVGDGPWHNMTEFHHNITDSKFDNFQFVNYTEIQKKYNGYTNIDEIFAMHILTKIPLQYKYIKENGLMYPSQVQSHTITESCDKYICSICCEDNKEYVFQCGHMICKNCKNLITECHICREPIQNIIRIYM